MHVKLILRRCQRLVSGARGGGWRKGDGPDWSDEEQGGNTSDFHRNVAAELVSFDKQYLPPGGQHHGHHGGHHQPH